MTFELTTRAAIASALLTLSIACSTDSPTSSVPSGTGPGSGQVGSGPTDSAIVARPGSVSGIAVDASGAPIAGATIWIRPAVTTGLLTATTDANGRCSVLAAFNIPYRAYAWTTVNYAGKSVCLRLASPLPTDYDSFVPGTPVMRNFILRGSGPVGNDASSHFGADLRLFVPGTPAGSRLMVTLTPTRTLLDGSNGNALTYDAAEHDLLITDIPIGVYSATAAFVDAKGARTPLEVSVTGYTAYDASATVQWQSKSSCVGSSSSGADRSFLWIHVPGAE